MSFQQLHWLHYSLLSASAWQPLPHQVSSDSSALPWTPRLYGGHRNEWLWKKMRHRKRTFLKLSPLGIELIMSLLGSMSSSEPFVISSLETRAIYCTHYVDMLWSSKYLEKHTLAAGSVKIWYALDSFWNRSDALGLSGFLSGWYFRAFFL